MKTLIKQFTVYTTEGIKVVNTLLITSITDNIPIGIVFFALGYSDLKEEFIPYINDSCEIPEKVMNEWVDDYTPIIDYIISIKNLK